MSARDERNAWHARSASRRAHAAGGPRAAWRPQLWLRARFPTRLEQLDRLVGGDAADAFIEFAVRQSSPLYKDVKIERRVLAFHDIYPLSRYIAPSRTHVARSYVSLMTERGLQLFEPMCFRRPGEKRYHVTLPPVVEPWNDTYVLIDGVHRMCALGAIRGRHALVVSLVSEHELPPLPGQPVNWTDISVEHRPQQRRRKFERLRRPFFRPAASYLRSDSLSFSSLSAITAACDYAVEMRDKPVLQFWCRRHRKLDDCAAETSSPATLRWDAEEVATG
jgi:hypothetical protein